jgi:hypothetical protein
VQRSIALAMLLADLSASGVPVDAISIAAAVVVDGVDRGLIPMDVVHTQLGMEVRHPSFHRSLCDQPCNFSVSQISGTHIVSLVYMYAQVVDA